MQKRIIGLFMRSPAPSAHFDIRSYEPALADDADGLVDRAGDFVLGAEQFHGERKTHLRFTAFAAGQLEFEKQQARRTGGVAVEEFQVGAARAALPSP